MHYKKRKGRDMTLSQAKTVMNGRLVFGDPIQIEASDIIVLAQKAAKLGRVKFGCEECGGLGECTCSACADGHGDDCPNGFACPKCKGDGHYEVNFASREADELEKVWFEDALGRL